MREILFKAKRIDNGEWVEGFYCKRKSYCFDKRTDELKTVIMTEFSSGGFVCYEVNPDTLCQYTGLTDKNGCKIWENDCIGHRLNVVEFLNGAWCVNGDRSLFFFAKEHKVIGNIFDNKELLEN